MCDKMLAEGLPSMVTKAGGSDTKHLVCEHRRGDFVIFINKDKKGAILMTVGPGGGEPLKWERKIGVHKVWSRQRKYIHSLSLPKNNVGMHRSWHVPRFISA